MTQLYIFFEVNLIDPYKDPILNDTVCDVQLSQEIASRVFRPLPYSKQKLQFLKKFQFQYSDLENFDYIQLCKSLVATRQCFATHRVDVGKISTPFWIRLTSDTKVQTQRPTKVPLHYRHKFDNLLDDLQKRKKKQVSSRPREKPNG